MLRNESLKGFALLIVILQMIGCSSSAQLQGPLNNADTGREVGLDLTRENGGLGLAYTHDKIGNVSGAAFLVWRLGGMPWSRRPKMLDIVYLPTGVHVDVTDPQQVKKWTVVEIEETSLKEMTPIVKAIPPAIFAVSKDDLNQALFLQISCGTACDQSRVHVRNHQFGSAKIFLWLERDNGHISPL